MPRPINVRKERATLAPEREETPQRVLVSQNQRLRQVRSNTAGLDQFVSRLGTFAHREKAEADLAEDKRLALQGEADAARGTVDDDLMQSSEIYVSAVNGALGEADAAVWSVEVRARADAARTEAHANGEEWDAQSFFQQEAAQVQEGEHFSNDTYAARWGRHLARVEAEILGKDAQLTASEEAEQANVALQSLVYAQMRAGSGFEEGVTKDYAESMGLDPQERVKATVAGVRSFISQTTTLEELSRAEAYYENMPTAQKALFGDDIANAIQARKSSIETANEKANAQDYRAKALFNHGLDKIIEAGDPTALDQIEAGRINGLLSDSEAETKVGKILTRNEEIRTEAAWDTNFVTFGENPERYALVTDSKERSHYQKRADETSARIVDALTQLTSNLSDPNNLPAVREGLNNILYEVKEVMDITRNTGLEGDPLTTLLNAAENPTVDNIVELAEIADSVEDTIGAGYLDNIGADARINLHRASIMTRAGYTPERIREVLSVEADGRTYDTAYGAVIAARKKGNRIANKEDPVLDARDDFEAMFAAEYYMRTGDLSGALTFAKKRSKEVLTEVDGRVVPKSGLPMGFGEQWGDIKPVMETALVTQGVIEKGTDWSLMPMAETDESGRFALFNDDTGDFIRDDDGRIRMLSGQDALMHYSGVVKVGEAKKEERVAGKAYQRADARVRGPDYIAANPEITEGISP